MTKIKRSKKSLKGAVLMMVLIVMYVLMIMLVATLTVVSSANSRAFLKYEENQSYYSARSALDLFLEDFMADDTNESTVPAQKYDVVSSSWRDIHRGTNGDHYADPGDCPGDATCLGGGNFSQGRVIELEMNTIETLDYNLGDYDYEKHNQPGIVVPGQKKLVYKMLLPETSSPDSNYGKLSDDGYAYISIQILERKYVDPDNGNYDIDLCTVKVTAEVTLDGITGRASLETTPIDKDEDEGEALMDFGPITSGTGAAPNPAGGASILDEGVAALGDGNNIYGNFFTVGSFEWTSSSTASFNGGDSVVAEKNITFVNNPTIVPKGKDVFFFAGDSIFLRGKIGTDEYPVTIAADTVTKLGGGQTDIYGNIVCNNYVMDAQSQRVSSGKIYTNNLTIDCWPQSVGEPPKMMLQLCNSEFVLSQKGTVNVPGNWSGSAEDFVSAVKNGDIIIESETGLQPEEIFTIDDSFEEYFFNQDPEEIVYMPESTISEITKKKKDSDKRIYRIINMPFTFENGSNRLIIPTASSKFLTNFVDDAFSPTNGSLMGGYDAANVRALLKLSTVPNYSVEANIETIGGKKYVTSSGYLDPNSANYSSTLYFDRNVSVSLLPNKYYFGEWRVSINAEIVVGFPADDDYFFNNFKLITQVDDSTREIYPEMGSVIEGETVPPNVDWVGVPDSIVNFQNNCFIAAYVDMPLSEFYVQNGSGRDIAKYVFDENTGIGTPVNFENAFLVGQLKVGKLVSGNKIGIIHLPREGVTSEFVPVNKWKPKFYYAY